MGGSKKKQSGGSAPRAPVEAPNTLQSKNTARIVDVLCEGPIKGLVNGQQSIFVDGTPLENPDGSLNFEGVNIAFRTGEPDQDALDGFSMVEVEESVGVKMLQNVGVVRQINDPDLDAVRIKVRVPQLTNQNMSNGNLGGSKVEFSIEVQSNGEPYRLSHFDSHWTSLSANRTASTATGLRLTVTKLLSGRAGMKVSTVLSAEYRKVGEPVWLSLGSRSLTYTIPNLQGVTASTTFTVIDLEAGVYEFRAPAGINISKQEQLIPKPIVISGKTTSPYEIAYRVPLTGLPPWNIRLTRLSPDSNRATLLNDIYFSTYTKIIDAKLSYPDTVLAGISVDAEQFGQDTPKRDYEIDALEIQVPSNYDPALREYSGIWDGTFQKVFCNNPAWVFYDLLVNNRYGLGQDIDPDQVDKFALYQIGQYCDELVPDGFGGMEPRFTLNCVINSRREAFDVLNAITSAFRGMAYWASGVVSAVQDAPADPVMLVTPANVIGGHFNYSSTSLKSRHTVVLVTWNDPLRAYEAAVEVVEDAEAIATYGWRQLDTVAFGCTSRGQARRFGQWILDTERFETETVSYEAGFDHVFVRPGDIVAIADPDYASVEIGGRLKIPGDTQALLDRPVTLTVGTAYTLSMVLPDGSIVDRVVATPAGITETVTWDEALPDIPLVGSLWVLTSTSLTTRKFRVLAVRENEQHQSEITALLHDPTKYDRVEQGLSLVEPVYTIFPSGPLERPTSLSGEEYLYQAGGSVKSAITLSWQASSDPRVGFYEVSYQGPDDPDYRFLRTVGGTSVDLLDTIPGTYRFRVRALDRLGGLQSQYLIAQFEFLGLLAPPQDVTNFQVSIVDDTAFLSWNTVPDLDLAYYVIKHSPATSGVTWATASILLPRVSRNATGATVQAMPGTYLIKAFDQSTPPQESVNAALITTTITELNGLNVVELFEEAPNFTGRHEGTLALNGELRLASSDTVDEWENIDDVLNWDIGEDGLLQEGFYYFENALDLGAVYTSRLLPTIEAYGANLFAMVEEWPDVDLVENWDGADSSRWAVELQVRTTRESPEDENWSEWQPLIVGDYEARAFEFRLILRSFEAGITPQVTTLSVEIDMPDRVAGGDDLLCPPEGRAVEFSPHFMAKPALAITAQGLGTGDYFELANITREGFDIQFKNAAGTGVSRTFDYVAKGYGTRR